MSSIVISITLTGDINKDRANVKDTPIIIKESERLIAIPTNSYKYVIHDKRPRNSGPYAVVIKGDRRTPVVCLTKDQDAPGFRLTNETFSRVSMVQLFNLHKWDVSGVVSMHGLFYNRTRFNGDISMWNVSNVRDMSFMFFGARVFNRPICRWDIRQVKTMESMFESASSFNQPLDSWCMFRLFSVARMFADAVSFNQSLGNWIIHPNADDFDMFAGRPVLNVGDKVLERCEEFVRKNSRQRIVLEGFLEDVIEQEIIKQLNQLPKIRRRYRKQ